MPVLDSSVRHLEELLEATVREGLQPVITDERMLKEIIALTDFYVWKSLRDRGMRDQGVDLISRLILFLTSDAIEPDDDQKNITVGGERVP